MTPNLFSLFDVACPFCGAQRGHRCAVVAKTERPKKFRVAPHDARRRAFREAKGQ